MRDKNNIELDVLVEKHELTNEVISMLTDYSIESVKAWRVKDPDSNRYRRMHNRALKLLKVGLSEAVEK